MAQHNPLGWLEATVLRGVAAVTSALWKPTDLDGCVLWLSPSRGVERTGDLVARWADQTGKHTVSAPNDMAHPRFVAKSDGLRGRPAIRFDRSGAVLEKQGGLQLPFHMKAFSAFVVLAPKTVGPRHGIPLLWLGSGAHVGFQVNARNAFHAYLERFFPSGVTLLTGKPYLLGIIYTDGKLTIYVNGTAVKTVTGVEMRQQNAGAVATLRVGGESTVCGTFHGDLGDIVVYRRGLDDAEVHRLGAQLLRHYRVADGAPCGTWGALEDLAAAVGTWLRRRFVWQ